MPVGSRNCRRNPLVVHSTRESMVVENIEVSKFLDSHPPRLSLAQPQSGD
jgi:hypothetical protein